MTRKTILFVGEAATLAHITRPLVLASALDRDRFDIVFACDPRYQWVLGELGGRFVPLPSMGATHFVAALARGAPVYDETVLTRYVLDDLKLLKEVTPDVVVGDFRLSLSISARLACVPYVGISNCYWSPYWRPKRYPVPSLPLTRHFPIPVADLLFQLARPIAFALHSRPLNNLRRQHGLKSLGFDLRRVYTDADHVLYADVPELFPDIALPSHHQFIGPLLWSPPVPYPTWWSSISDERPIVYVTMGSSGCASMLPVILQSLAPLHITVIAATAGGTVRTASAKNAYVAEYLPGLEAARRSSLVVCNGGAPTCHHALAAGVPVIGLPSNLDQFLNIDTLVRAGAGVVERADRVSENALRSSVGRILADRSYRSAAQRIADAVAKNDPRTNFMRVLDSL